MSSWPPIESTLDHSGAGEITINGTRHQITATSLDEARTQVIAAVTQQAQSAQRPLRLVTVDPTGTWPLLVHPDGTLEADMTSAPQEPTGAHAVSVDADQSEAEQTQQRQHQDGASPAMQGPQFDGQAPLAQNRPGVPPVVESFGGAHRGGRPSFITAGRSIQPAQQGWRGTLNKLGPRLAPGPVEVAYRDDVKAVAQHWPGPRTIAVANPKGSAGKTPATACLAAVFAREGGSGVLAWDNNETRGSLPWRTETAAHNATVLDLLPRVDALLASGAQYAEMNHYVHHQPDDKYDVLNSDQSVVGDHVVSAEEFDHVHRVAARYYRLALVDSGNSERAPNWRAMMRHAHRLVVPCTNVEDTAEAGARMLEALATRDEHSARLAAEAVVIVSQRSPGRDPNMPRIVGGFRDLGHTVIQIPYDAALRTGVIRFEALRPSTQRAWLSAAAAVARGL